MSDRPYVTCLMISSVDGRLHPSCYTANPDGAVEDWNNVYAELHDALDADAWLVGRVTMAEMAKGEFHPRPADAAPDRPVHKAPGASPPFAVAFDRDARLHFAKPDIGGDHVVMLLGHDVSDEHLAELAGDGISYVTAPAAAFDAGAMLGVLKREFGVERLALEGGGGTNGTMIAAGLVDEFHVLVAPALDGQDGRQGIVIAADGGLKGKASLSLLGSETRAHGTVLLRYAVSAAAA